MWVTRRRLCLRLPGRSPVQTQGDRDWQSDQDSPGAGARGTGGALPPPESSHLHLSASVSSSTNAGRYGAYFKKQRHTWPGPSYVGQQQGDVWARTEGRGQTPQEVDTRTLLQALELSGPGSSASLPHWHAVCPGKINPPTAFLFRNIPAVVGLFQPQVAR